MSEIIEADKLEVPVKFYDESEINAKAEAIAEYQMSTLEVKIRMLLQKAYESNLGFLALLVLLNQLFAQFEDMGGTLGKGISYISVWALQKGRWAAVRESGKRMKGKQFVAILDERTCKFCQFIDGKVIFENNPDYQIMSVPFHYLCRCLEIPVYDYEMDTETYTRPSNNLIRIGGGLLPIDVE